MANLPQSAKPLGEALKLALQNKNVASHSELVALEMTLRDKRKELDSLLLTECGDDWDEQFPEVFAVFAEVAQRLEELARMKTGEAFNQTAITAPERKWRNVKTKSVDVNDTYWMDYVIHVEQAILHNSQANIWSTLERLLIFLRDNELCGVANSSHWKNHGTRFEDLRNVASRLVDNPQKDDWEEFLMQFFPEAMKERKEGAKLRNTYGQDRPFNQPN